MTIQDLINELKALGSIITQYVTGTWEQYNALQEKDEGTLYYITDRNVIYKGDKCYSGVQNVVCVKPQGDASENDKITVTFTLLDGTEESIEIVPHAAMQQHIDKTGSNIVSGHVKLSDAIDSQSDANQGTAATPKAVNDALTAAKQYADEQISAGFAANDVQVMKGSVNGNGIINSEDTAINGLNINAITDYKTGWSFRVTEKSDGSLWSDDEDTEVEAGDMIIALRGYSGSNQSSDWFIVQSNLIGAVTTNSNDLTQDNLIIGDGNQKVKPLANGSNGQVVTLDNGKPQWKDNVDTTYTFADGTDGSFNVTSNTGQTQKVSIGKPANAGHADTSDKVAQTETTSSNHYMLMRDANGNVRYNKNVTLNKIKTTSLDIITLKDAGWVRIVSSGLNNYRGDGGRLVISNGYTSYKPYLQIIDFSFLYENTTNKSWYNCLFGWIFTKIRFFANIGVNYLDLYYPGSSYDQNFTIVLEKFYYNNDTSLTLQYVPEDDSDTEGTAVEEYDITQKVNQTNVPYKAPEFIGKLTGTADMANKLANLHSFKITGNAVSDPVNFDGSGDVTLQVKEVKTPIVGNGTNYIGRPPINRTNFTGSGCTAIRLPSTTTGGALEFDIDFQQSAEYYKIHAAIICTSGNSTTYSCKFHVLSTSLNKIQIRVAVSNNHIYVLIGSESDTTSYSYKNVAVNNIELGSGLKYSDWSQEWLVTSISSLEGYTLRSAVVYYYVHDSNILDTIGSIDTINYTEPSSENIPNEVAIAEAITGIIDILTWKTL